MIRFQLAFLYIGRNTYIIITLYKCMKFSLFPDYSNVQLMLDLSCIHCYNVLKDKGYPVPLKCLKCRLPDLETVHSKLNKKREVKEMKVAESFEIANQIIERIENLESKLERANKALIPEKGDTPIDRDVLLVHIARRIRTTGSCIAVSTHTGKMLLIPSISTICKCNGNCADNQLKDGSICQFCFAEGLTNERKNLRYAMIINYILLTSILFESFELPTLNAVYARLESFGDLEKEELGGVIQGRNYVRIIRKNYRTKWAWWTKNPVIMGKALDAEGGKPENLTCVLSSMFVNVSYDYDSIKRRFYFIDIIFTVYDKDYIKENGIVINCGSRDCFNCGRCYDGKFKGHVLEQKK